MEKTALLQEVYKEAFNDELEKIAVGITGKMAYKLEAARRGMSPNQLSTVISTARQKARDYAKSPKGELLKKIKEAGRTR